MQVTAKKSRSGPASELNFRAVLRDTVRDGVEYRALELLISAYRQMLKEKRFEADWKETKFSAVLVGYMSSLAQELGQLTNHAWDVIREFYNDDDKVVSGVADPDAVPRIDIVVRTWNASFASVTFPFECKLLSEHDTDHPYLYVKKGISRYTSGDKHYSGDAFWGGMIGYVVEGNHSAIVILLNDQIDKQHVPGGQKRYLRKRSPVGGFVSLYRSQHKHPRYRKLLSVTHVLLPFT